VITTNNFNIHSKGFFYKNIAPEAIFVPGLKKISSQAGDSIDYVANRHNNNKISSLKNTKNLKRINPNVDTSIKILSLSLNKYFQETGIFSKEKSHFQKKESWVAFTKSFKQRLSIVRRPGLDLLDPSKMLNFTCGTSITAFFSYLKNLSLSTEPFYILKNLIIAWDTLILYQGVCPVTHKRALNCNFFVERMLFFVRAHANLLSLENSKKALFLRAALISFIFQYYMKNKSTYEVHRLFLYFRPLLQLTNPPSLYECVFYILEASGNKADTTYKNSYEMQCEALHFIYSNLHFYPYLYSNCESVYILAVEVIARAFNLTLWDHISAGFSERVFLNIDNLLFESSKLIDSKLYNLNFISKDAYQSDSFKPFITNSKLINIIRTFFWFVSLERNPLLSEWEKIVKLYLNFCFLFYRLDLIPVIRYCLSNGLKFSVKNWCTAIRCYEGEGLKCYEVFLLFKEEEFLSKNSFKSTTIGNTVSYTPERIVTKELYTEMISLYREVIRILHFSGLHQEVIDVFYHMVQDKTSFCYFSIMLNSSFGPKTLMLIVESVFISGNINVVKEITRILTKSSREKLIVNLRTYPVYGCFDYRAVFEILVKLQGFLYNQGDHVAVGRIEPHLAKLCLHFGDVNILLSALNYYKPLRNSKISIYIVQIYCNYYKKCSQYLKSTLGKIIPFLDVLLRNACYHELKKFFSVVGFANEEIYLRYLIFLFSKGCYYEVIKAFLVDKQFVQLKGDIRFIKFVFLSLYELKAYESMFLLYELLNKETQIFVAKDEKNYILHGDILTLLLKLCTNENLARKVNKELFEATKTQLRRKLNILRKSH
jgi:hypothetical protein